VAKFTDSKGNEWVFRFGVPMFIKVCRKLDVSLNDVITMQLPVADLIESIPILIEDQLKEKGITPEQFLEQLAPSEMMELFNILGATVKEAFPDNAEGKSTAPFGLGESTT